MDLRSLLPGYTRVMLKGHKCSIKIIVYFDHLNLNENEYCVFTAINSTWSTQHRYLEFEPVEAKSFLRDRFASTSSRRCDVLPSGETIWNWTSGLTKCTPFGFYSSCSPKKLRVSKYLSSISKPSCCWHSRSYFSLVQTSLLYAVRHSHRPLLKKFGNMAGGEFECSMSV